MKESDELNDTMLELKKSLDTWTPDKKPKTIGIVGSRRRDSLDDFRLCEKEFLKHYQKGDIIVSGGCPKGGDKFAEMLAFKHDVEIKIHPANWDKYGKAAGFKRNTYIAEDADIIIAVVAADRTGGTEDTLKKASKMGKTIYLV